MKLIFRFLRMLLFLTLLLLVYTMGRAQEVEAENSINDSLSVIIQTADSANTEESIGVNSQYSDENMIEDVVPRTPVLNQNYPNPFNPSTDITFSLISQEQVSLSVFNLLGQNVRMLVEEVMGEGFHKVHWDGRDDLGRRVPGGIYFCRIKAGNWSATRKMVALE